MTSTPTTDPYEFAWQPCDGGCGDFWCVLHEMHAHDCPCPPIEDWAQPKWLKLTAAPGSAPEVQAWLDQVAAIIEPEADRLLSLFMATGSVEVKYVGRDDDVRE